MSTGTRRSIVLPLPIDQGETEMVDIFSRPRDEWADALDGLDMPRCAKAIHRQIQP